MFRWAEHVDDDHVERVRTAFDALGEQVANVLHHAHGNDVGLSEGTFDYHVVADFETVADWRAYRDHPARVLLIEELVVGHVAERAGGQFHTADHRSAHDVSPAATGLPTETNEAGAPDPSADETDDELMARARRAAMAEMQALLAEPDEL